MRPSCRLISLLLLLLVTACSHAPPAAPSATTAPPPPKPLAKTQITPTLPAPVKPGTAPAARDGAPQVAPAGSTQVALLLPLSGSSAALGNAMLNASQLALFDLADGDFSLLPFDSKGTAEGAATAARQALAQHVDIIVGPLFAAEVRAVAPLAMAGHVPLLSLSADRSVAGQGSYVLGFLPGPQALAISDFAAGQGRRRQAILAPATEYGRIVATELINAASTHGAVIGPVEYYDPAGLDLSASLKRLLAGRKGDDPGFDALLLPDDGQRLRRVSEQWLSMAPSLGIDPSHVALLGTMLWEDAHPGDLPALAGGWFTAPAPGFTDFAKRYGKAFGAAPPRLASLAYDAMALVAVLGRGASHDFSPGILTNPQGFAGVDGLFRLRLDGTTQRAYAIKEVVSGGTAKEIQPAAPNFGT